MTTKAAYLRPHATYILAEDDWCQVRCDDCDYSSPEFDGRRYLAENAADEHQRAMAGWPQ